MPDTPEPTVDQRPSTNTAARHLASVFGEKSGTATDGPPVVLFLCTHNAGRSQMALGWFNHLAGDSAVAWSGGSEPGTEINPAAIAAMAEVGIDITGEYPKPWTDEIVQAADVVITMGCGDACPIFPGIRGLGDPAVAMARIAPVGPFIARGDGSARKRRSWRCGKRAGVDPATVAKREETGQGMGATLLVAEAAAG